VFTQIIVPNSIYTYTTGVNDNGEIAGWYLDSSDRMHSFTATPTAATPEAASFALLTLGCGVLWVQMKRKRAHSRLVTPLPQNTSTSTALP